MQIIGTLSLTQHVMDWLGNSSHPRILHVFDRACNLINERNEVLSVVSQQIGNGPFHLVAEDEILFSNHLNIESAVSISDNQLMIGEFVIEIANAPLWNPCLEWEKVHNHRDKIVDQLEQIQITNCWKPGDFFHTHLDDQARLLNHRNLQFSKSLTSTLSSALVKADISLAKSVASRLAGLGIGLTPSGDDFMMGALYAAWIIHPPEVAGLLASEIAEIVAPLTTSLSAAWIRSAGRGEAGILWHRFFDELLSSDFIRVQSAMDNILAVGATSGADALAGFIHTFTLYVELEKKHVIPKFT